MDYASMGTTNLSETFPPITMVPEAPRLFLFGIRHDDTLPLFEQHNLTLLSYAVKRVAPPAALIFFSACESKGQPYNPSVTVMLFSISMLPPPYTSQPNPVTPVACATHVLGEVLGPDHKGHLGQRTLAQHLEVALLTNRTSRT